MTKKILVTQTLPQPALDLLSSEFEVDLFQSDLPMPKSQILERAKDCDALLCLLTDRIDRETISRLNKVRVISNYAVGYNNIDTTAASERGIAVCYTPGVLTETSADLAWALIMSVARKILPSDQYLRAGKFKAWHPMLFLGSDIYGKTLGIIGLGRIGSAVAKRARGFNMKVLHHSRSNKPDLEAELQAEPAPLSDLLSQSDFVSVHVPLSDETKGLIGEKELSLMKPSAFLINTSRGEVVDEQALLEALKSKKIAGAALDVFEREPEVTAGLLELDNVVLTPHIGSASLETRTQMALMAAENAIKVVRGECPEAIVDAGVLGKG